MISLKLDKRFAKQAKGVFEKYEFFVGILKDGHHLEAKSLFDGLGEYAGGPVRKTSRKQSQKMISEVSEDLRNKMNINFYTLPFQAKKNKDILNFVREFFELCAGRGEVRRAENLLQAIVRNPILRGDYGKNIPITAKIKGFNRLMIETAQVFKAITAKVQVISVQK